MNHKIALSSIISLILVLFIASCNRPSVNNSENSNNLPEIFPDYTDLVLPPNIAPLNFTIQEKGKKYFVEFSGDNKQRFSISTKSKDIMIPIKKWKKLLANNISNSIQTNIFILQENNIWKRYSTIENKIASDSIDPFIVYRRINPGMILWDDMAIVQRSLETFYESDIISNQNTENNCIHCHTFQNRDPENMILHMRRSPSGTLIKTKEKTLWLTTKTEYTLSSFAYPAWHPQGQYIAFSTNKIHQNFFGHGNRINHVRDDASDIVVYDIVKNEVFTDPQIASRDFENLPAWSPDGRYLYYIQCSHDFKHQPDSIEKYDLMRIEFDVENHSWGKPEMLVSSKETGMSVSFPQVSPDGQTVLFCLADYGYFTINNFTSNLYLLDLGTGKMSILQVNSDQSESFPSWSGNGRWILFSSKRYDGMITFPFLSYIDSTGTAHKPFVVPLKNPRSYNTRLTNFNRPVFISDKIKLTQKEIVGIAYRTTGNVVFDSLHVDLDALAGATVKKDASVDEVRTLYKKN